MRLSLRDNLKAFRAAVICINTQHGFTVVDLSRLIAMTTQHRKAPADSVKLLLEFPKANNFE